MYSVTGYQAPGLDLPCPLLILLLVQSVWLLERAAQSTDNVEVTYTQQVWGYVLTVVWALNVWASSITNNNIGVLSVADIVQAPSEQKILGT